MLTRKVRYIPIVAFWTRPTKGTWDYFSVGNGTIAKVITVEGGYNWFIFKANTNNYKIKVEISGFSLKLTEAKQIVESILRASGTAIKKVILPLFDINTRILALPPPTPKLTMEPAKSDLDAKITNVKRVVQKRSINRHDRVKNAFKPKGC